MTDDKLYLLAVSTSRHKINVKNEIDTKKEGMSSKLGNCKWTSQYSSQKSGEKLTRMNCNSSL